MQAPINGKFSVRIIMRVPLAAGLLCTACAYTRLSEAFMPPISGRLMQRGVVSQTSRGARIDLFRPASVEPQEGQPVDTQISAEQVAAAEEEKMRRREEAARNAMEMEKLKAELARGKQNKLVTAVASAVTAVVLFFYQHLHPVEAVTLLRQMQLDSPAIESVVANGRPTVVDFYAEWCENCKEMAPTLRQLEGRYKDKVNFVVINGDTPAAADLVEKFRVDGIPHFALISRDGEVRTALIGKVPKRVMEADLEALLSDKALPYEGYDAFEDEDHYVRF